MLPDVALVDHEGRPWRISDHRGRPLVLMLHPRLAAYRTYSDLEFPVVADVDRIASTEDATALAVEGIDVVDGFARFTSPTAVSVDGRAIAVQHGGVS